MCLFPPGFVRGGEGGGRGRSLDDRPDNRNQSQRLPPTYVARTCKTKRMLFYDALSCRLVRKCPSARQTEVHIAFFLRVLSQ